MCYEDCLNFVNKFENDEEFRNDWINSRGYYEYNECKKFIVYYILEHPDEFKKE